jgi:hypothetical protein
LSYEQERTAPGRDSDIPGITYKNQYEIAKDCMAALVWKGGSNSRWPIGSDRAAIAVEGAVIAALCSKYIMPYEGFFLVINDKEYFQVVWEIFWKAHQVKANKKKLNSRFLAVIMYLFKPIEESVDIREKAYTTVNFAGWWGFAGLGYPDTMMGRTCRVRRDVLDYGKRKYKLLPQKIQQSVDQVAVHIPQTLEIIRAV